MQLYSDSKFVNGFLKSDHIPLTKTISIVLHFLFILMLSIPLKSRAQVHDTLLCVKQPGVTVELRPTSLDEDGNIDQDKIFAKLQVGQLIDSTLNGCLGFARYGILRADSVDNGYYRAAEALDTLTFDCNDHVVRIYVYAFDQNGKIFRGTGFVLVEDKGDFCYLAPAYIRISGNIETENGEPIQNVYLEANEPVMPAMVQTDTNGNYTFEMSMWHHIKLRPRKNDAPLNGVSTLDLLAMYKHVLGVEYLGSPYKLIAADVNHSGSISIMDIIQVRKLILGITDTLLNNSSWRFIDRDYAFPDAMNPWLEPFPEESIGLSRFNSGPANFIGVKVGDVNGDARTKITN